MTSYQFEVVAKNAVIDVMKKDYDIDLKIKDIDFVWFAHELGYKKCAIYGPKMRSYYAEVTYNRDTFQMYIDIYEKKSFNFLNECDFNYEVKNETA